MKRPRVALLRGAYLGSFEAQNYEPLLDRFDIRAYVLPQNRFDLSGCRLPVEVCYFPDAWRGGRSLINAWRTRILKQRYPMPGVARIAASAQIVHTFEAWYTYTQQAARACRAAGVPLVITHWDTLPYSQSVDQRARDEIDETLHAASKVVATTAAARSALLLEHVPEEKIIVQGMGVDTTRFSPGERSPALARRLGIGDRDFVYLFLGRLAPEKGIRDLVGAFYRVSQERTLPSSKLLLVGHGPEEEWVRRQAASWGLQERLLLAPPVAYAEVHLWHRLGDLFVFPSVPSERAQEQFGYALVEAMSSGQPVITTNTGGIPEVVGNCACRVAPGDVDALAAAMIELRRNEGERRRLASLARQRALERYSSMVVAERLGRIYDDLLENSAA